MGTWNTHYKNQPPEKRDEVNDILTELVAFTEELIYTDYLKQNRLWKGSRNV